MKPFKNVKLGDVAQFIRGINFKPDDVVPVGTDGTVACMRTKNVQELLDCGDVWGVSESFVRRPEQMLNKGDILVSSANSWNLVGKCCWIPDLPWRTTFGGFISALRADSKQTDPRFLYWWFSSERTQALLRSFGQKTTNISNLNIDRCLNLSIPFPPLFEQRRIAAILDQADALRVKRRESLAQLDSLTQSIFIEMFGDPSTNPKGWVVNPLSNFISTVTNGLTRRRSASDEGVDIVLRLRDIRSGWIDFSDVNRITLEPSEAKRYCVSSGDLLFIRVNGNPDYVGRCAIFEGHSEPVFFNDHIMRVKVDPTRIHSVFLAFLLNNKHGKNEIAKYRKTSAGQHTINQDGLGKIQISTPPIALQTEFVHRMESIGRQKNVFSESLAELDALFASLQHRAFRGEL